MLEQAASLEDSVPNHELDEEDIWKLVPTHELDEESRQSTRHISVLFSPTQTVTLPFSKCQ